MLRDDLRPSVLERTCSGEVMLFCLASVFSQVSSIGVTSGASPSCCIILTYIRRMTRGFRGPGRCEVTFFTDRWRGLRLFRRCLTPGVLRPLLWGACVSVLGRGYLALGNSGVCGAHPFSRRISDSHFCVFPLIYPCAWELRSSHRAPPLCVWKQELAERITIVEEESLNSARRC